MKIIKNIDFDQNTYILDIDNKLVIIDPGYNDQKIMTFLKNKSPDLILLTHYHFDHVACTDILCDKYKINAYINEDDYDLLLNNKLASSMMGLKDVFIKQKNIRTFKTKISVIPSLKIIKAPGHSEGSVLFEYKNMLFTGDVLFNNASGWTHLIGSDNEKQVKSLNAFKTYDGNLHVYPGHGKSNTLSKIIENNNFFKTK